VRRTSVSNDAESKRERERERVSRGAPGRDFKANIFVVLQSEQ